MFIDARSAAARPAGLKVRWVTHFRYHPGWLLFLLAGLVATIWAGVTRNPAGWGIALMGAIIAFLHLRYVRARSAGGMLCPAVSISERPFLVAVLTDLAATPEKSHPILKVFDPPPAAACPTGTRLAAVVLYSGYAPAGHWDDCHPSLAATSNAEPSVQESLLKRVLPEEWENLERACQRLALPPRRGLIRLVAI